MALVKNEKNEWAWVSTADEKPKKFFATQDEALKNANMIEGGTTKDSAEKCYTTERGEFVD